MLSVILWWILGKISLFRSFYHRIWHYFFLWAVALWIPQLGFQMILTHKSYILVLISVFPERVVHSLLYKHVLFCNFFLAIVVLQHLAKQNIYHCRWPLFQLWLFSSTEQKLQDKTNNNFGSLGFDIKWRRQTIAKNKRLITCQNPGQKIIDIVKLLK